MNNRIVSSYSNENNNLRNVRNVNPNEENNNNNVEANVDRWVKQISIQYSCCTPYFKLGKMIFFYCPNSLSDLNISDKYFTNTFDLSQMPDPPFCIGSQCKTFLSTFLCIFIFSILILLIEFLVIKNIAYNFISLALFILSVLTGILTYIINPGTTFKENNQEGNKHHCGICKFTYPKSDKKYEHCSMCEVCVAGPDHHCGIFEKCIGRKNIACFYLFPVFSMVLLVVFLVSVFHSVTKKAKDS